MKGEKDTMKWVVGWFWFRGGPTTTRLGELVVRDVLSCLRVICVLGMIIRRRGIRILQKRRDMVK